MNDKVAFNFGPRYSNPKNPVGYGDNGYLVRIETWEEEECENTFTKRSPNQNRCETCQAAANLRTQARAVAKAKLKR